MRFCLPLWILTAGIPADTMPGRRGELFAELSTVEFQKIGKELARELGKPRGEQQDRGDPEPGAADYSALQSTVARWLEQHPKLVSRVELGSSVAGRPLFALRIGRQDDGVPEVYLGGGIHGHERSEEDLLFMVGQLLARREEPAIAQLLRERSLWAQPVINPDGMVRRERKNAHGVDLNRNFAARWRPALGTQGRDNPGSEPFCEPETRAVRDLLLARRDLRVSLDLHRSVNALIVPQVGDAGLVDDRAHAAGLALDEAMGRFSFRGVRGLPHWPTMRGLSLDWIWDALGVTAFSLEFREPIDGPPDRDPRWLALLHLLRIAEELPRARREPAAHSPVLVTAQTRADREELARLQTPGEVLFRDGFDDDASLGNYFELLGKDRDRITIHTEAPHSGAGALQLVTEDRGGEACGAGVRLWLDKGRECLHLRYWIRYAADYDQGNLNHTGGSISGVAGEDKWRGLGTAGKRPVGDDHCSTRVEGWRDWQRVPAPGFLFSYTYWMDMARDPDGNFWGNLLMPVAVERCVPPRDRWLCVEQRLQLNTPGRDNGELAVWLNGELYTHWRGLRWRSADALLCRRIALDLYVHESRRQNRVWYDDVVVSTGYIGP